MNSSMDHIAVWAPSQYTKRRLFVRSREVSKSRDWYFKLLHRFEIWQAHRQPCCRSACQISERSDNSKYKSRGFETLRDLTERRLIGYWDGALDTHKVLRPLPEITSVLQVRCKRIRKHLKSIQWRTGMNCQLRYWYYGIDFNIYI